MKIYMKLPLILMLIITVFTVYAQQTVHIGPRANNYDDPANGIYVSPTGNDATADGSIDKPYKSINTALGKVQSGGTIILRNGVYKEGRRTRIQKSNITIKSRKGEWGVIDLTTYDAGNQEHSAVDFYSEDQTTRNVLSGGKLQCIEVIGGYYAVTMETKWNWGGDDDWKAASDIIIEDCKLHDSRNDVVKVKPNSKNITIRYNEIYNSGKEFNDCGNPDGRSNAEGIDNVNGNNMVVQNNYIHDICTNGIYAKGGATNALIENNRIERANGSGIQIGFETNLEYFDTKVNPRYYENINGVVRNNLIINTVLSGIGLYAAKDAQIYNNTLVNVNTHGSYHSAIYFGVATQDGEPYKGSPPNINPDIHHNIVNQPTTFVRPIVEIRYSIERGIYHLSALDGKPKMNNNCYYIAGKNASFTDNRPDGIKNAGLAAWKTHIGGENGTIEANPSLNANYMPTNTQCAGMGIQYILSTTTGNDTPAFVPVETSAYIYDGILTIQNPVAETVQVYAINGTLLYNFQKPDGKASYSLNQPKGTILIIRGSAGWSKELIMQ
jgi:hypothetical protein